MGRKTQTMPNYTVLDEPVGKYYRIKWFDSDGKLRYRCKSYKRLQKEEAYKIIMEERYKLMTAWLETNKGLQVAETQTDPVCIESIDDECISDNEEMTLTTKNFSYDLFSFDPEWQEDDMDQLLEGVENRLDFKEVIERNADKISITNYVIKDEICWNANEIGKIFGYANRKIKDIINAAGLVKGKHFKVYSDIEADFKGANGIGPLKNMQPHQKFLTQRGLMRLLMYSDKPVAKTFKIWVELVMLKISNLSNKMLEDHESRNHLVIEELERQKLSVEMIKAEKKHYLYIFTNDYYKKNWLYKYGVTDNLDQRLISLQNGDKFKGGYYVKTNAVYDSKLSERVIHQAFDLFKLRHSGEWFRVPDNAKAIDILDSLSDGLNDMYGNIATIPEELAHQIDQRIRELGGEPQASPRAITPSKEEVMASYVNKLMEANGLNKGKFETKIKELNKEHEFKCFVKELPKSVDDLQQKSNVLKINLTINHKGTSKIVNLTLNLEE